jgi:hypothetical protein
MILAQIRHYHNFLPESFLPAAIIIENQPSINLHGDIGREELNRAFTKS